MREKRRALRARTILTDDLYVRRAADDQLALIVEDMGRPGYVLVSRQMGKTNLLLHMKRHQEEAGGIVVYIDLSQRFENARECFRYIIDVTIDTNEELLSSVANKIRDERVKSSYDASLEYTKHLRLLLKNNHGRKIIIVLDEIDSLVNAAYSDTILAHVRSTYFVRTNYPEFERLTYVLSGVAEPSDLIKDKNISPFNIGEKIYLNDFSFAEFETFLSNVSLNLDGPVRDRVYYWSQGNPRVSWDICAALEERVDAGAHVSATDVDEIVQRLYLASFDRPPVDHIRVLVENDGALRASIVAIRYGKGASLDEKARSRLYLAGIIGDPAESPSIRNPVIDAALSDTWLSKLDALHNNPVTMANEHFIGRRYMLAKEMLEQIRASGTQLSANQAMMLGMSNHNLGFYEEATAGLVEAVPRLRGENRTTAAYHLGSSYLLLDKPQEALSALTSAAREGSGPYRFPAEILTAAANYRLEETVDEELRAESKARIIAAAAEESVGSDLGDSTVVPSLIYSVAMAALASGEVLDAKDYLKSAASVAPPGLLPRLNITLYSIETDFELRREWARLAADAIIDNQLHPVEDASEITAYTERGLVAVIFGLLDVDNADAVHRLLSFVQTNERIIGSKRGFVARLLSKYSDLRVEDGTIERMFDVVGSDDASPHDDFQMRRALAIHASSDEKPKALDAVLRHIQEYPDLRLDNEDFSYIISAIQSLFHARQFERAAIILEAANKHLEPGIDTVWRLILLYYLMAANQSSGNRSAARRAATKVMEVRTLLDGDSPEEISEVLNTVIDLARRILGTRPIQEPDQYRGIGRNQKVIIRKLPDGPELTSKFKFVEGDLRAGTSELVRVLPS